MFTSPDFTSGRNFWFIHIECSEWWKRLLHCETRCKWNFLWATSAGGTQADIGNAISVDPSGNVLSPDNSKEQQLLVRLRTSMINPNTLFPSIDIFISKLGANGNFLWTKHGAAEFTDRALDIVCDNSGSAYICGQFSDTIQFAATYNNP